MNRPSLLTLTLLLLTTNTHAFTTPHLPPSTSKTSLNAVIPAPVELEQIATAIEAMEALDWTIVAVSAAAGVASQVPILNSIRGERDDLEVRLKETEVELNKSKKELIAQVSEYEEKLFQLDAEYEGQTSQIRQSYQKTLSNELTKLSTKLKSQFQFERQRLSDSYEKETELKLKVREEELKMGFLEDRLEYVRELGEKKREEIGGLMEERSRMSSLNKRLEEALEGDALPHFHVQHAI